MGLKELASGLVLLSNIGRKFKEFSVRGVKNLLQNAKTLGKVFLCISQYREMLLWAQPWMRVKFKAIAFL